MQDEETHTWWQQVTGEAFLGPLKGKRLEAPDWEEVTFRLWKQEQPGSLVLQAVKKYQDDYATPEWEINILKRPTVTPVSVGDRMKPKDLVIGVKLGNSAKAYPLSSILAHNPVVDALGASPVVLVAGPDGKTIRCFSRKIEGQTLDLFLKPSSNPLSFIDSQTGSEWDFSGKAVRGPLSGKTLERIPLLKDFWFDWKLYNPQTQIFLPGKLLPGRTNPH